KKVYEIDSSAQAVVLADIGFSTIEGNDKGWFSLVHKHFKRVHILNKNAYDLANVSIGIYTNGEAEEELDKLKAITYNLENGKVVETKLDVKSNVFKDKIDKNLVVKKFTFPNVKEGSIIEYEYILNSDFLTNLQPWVFQGEYPCLWSEYNLGIPDFFKYLFITQGYLNYDIKENKQNRSNFGISVPGGTGRNENLTFFANVTDYRWVIKNSPALKEENYTTTIKNHIQKIEFQLSEQSQPLKDHRYIESWPKVSEQLLERESFGLQLNKDNGWLNDLIKPLVTGVNSQSEKAKRIFEYVRNNFTCTDHSGSYLSQTIKNVVKTRNGNVAEINLLLIAMLKHEKIQADPVILSTRTHGATYSLYPLLYQYNYVICKIEIDGKAIYLDATEPLLGFGRLPIRCYNGPARVINKDAPLIDFSAGSLLETKVTSVFIVNDEKGNLIGSMQQTPGYYESFRLRDRIKEKGKEQLQKDIKQAFITEIEISNFQLDSLDKTEEPFFIKYDFDIKEEKADIIYLYPMFGEGYKENPFKSAERAYPVEMPYAFDETFNLQLDVPIGYVVDELPKSMIVKLNEENEGIFEYRISHSGGVISFRSRVRISRAFFLPEEYEMLREFFNLVVKKQAEQIVFKKKN
ncbi:MAG: transglutaminase domain-containing protein, partial [Chitinophagaceae bacterium]